MYGLSPLYSNKSRGMQAKQAAVATTPTPVPVKKCSLAWAALIRLVYEVDPWKCPKCGSQMEVISFIEREDVIEKILKHSGHWRESPDRPPPPVTLAA
jgi:hypothetical protein